MFYIAGKCLHSITKKQCFIQFSVPPSHRGERCYFCADKSSQKPPRGGHMRLRLRTASSKSHMMPTPWTPITGDAGLFILFGPSGAHLRMASLIASGVTP